MKYILLIFCFLCLCSCKTDDDNDIDCALFDPANSNLFIKLIDSDGNNLIENNTIIADDIKILFNGYTMTNVVYNKIGQEKLIYFSLIGGAGNNTFEIQLSNEITDTLVLDLDLGAQVCGWTFLLLHSATYNGVLQTLEDFNVNHHLITIIK